MPLAPQLNQAYTRWFSTTVAAAIVKGRYILKKFKDTFTAKKGIKTTYILKIGK